MPSFRFLRVVGLAAVLIAVSFGVVRVAAVSAAHTATTAVAGTSNAARQSAVPFGYGVADGAGVEIRKVSTTPELPVDRINVHNLTTQTITGLRFVVVAEALPFVSPVRIFSSELEKVSIAPNATEEVSSNVAAGAFPQLASLGARVQGFISVQEVRYANGTAWQMTPNPNATNSLDALALRAVPLARELVGALSPDPSLPHGCLDQNKKGYSQGAIVNVLNEPGRRARCNEGRWDEYSDPIR